MANQWFDVLLRQKSYRWLVTGAAGFIGSHLIEFLLASGQEVVGLDDFSTGKHEHLATVEASLGPRLWRRFRLIEGDIRNAETCLKAAESCDFILHQAALGSVPLSVSHPELTHDVNVQGFLNILQAAVKASVSRVVYASSCAVYGDQAVPALSESCLLKPLSPYAASKATNEHFARAFFESYGLSVVGLRYFNVYGQRQDPQGAYAAVIPRWMQQLQQGQELLVHGDGENTRDFVHVSTVVAANVAAALYPEQEFCEVFNVASGRSYSLNELLGLLSSLLNGKHSLTARRGPSRKGDIRHSAADTAFFDKKLKIQKLDFAEGLRDLWISSSHEAGVSLSKPSDEGHTIES